MNNPYNFDLPTHRMVDGERVNLTSAEVQALLDEWTHTKQAEEARAAEPKPPTLEERVKALEDAKLAERVK